MRGADMVTKFNLSVPDELAAKIKERREYLGSLSAIFQQAVSEKIKKKEKFEKRLEGGDDMEATIERLKEEKQKAEVDYREKGQDAGLVWAKAASYTDLEYARQFEPFDRHGEVDPTTILHDDVLGHYFIETLEADPLTNPEADEDVLNDFATQWLDGWLNAVYDFWAEIISKL